MSSKRVRFVAIAGAAFVALVVIISLLVAKISQDTLYMALPETQAGSSDTQSGGSDTDDEIVRVEVTTETVQAVIATMQRPVSYWRQVQVTNYYGDESAVYDIEVCVLEQAKSVEITGAGYTKNIILAGDMLYVWEDGEQDYYEAALDASEDSDRLVDMYQMILTYEDVLEVEASQITDAGYGELNGEMCIVVGYITQQLGYKTTCYISVEKGLVIAAEQYDADELIYSMSSSDFTTEIQDDSPFDLPDGANVLDTVSND